MVEVIDRIKNYAASKIPFLRRENSEPGQIIFFGERLPEPPPNLDDERFESVTVRILETLNIATFRYENLLKDKFTFPLTGADFKLLRTINRFIPSARNVGGRLEIYPNYARGAYKGSRLALLLPEEEIKKGRIKHTEILFAADIVNEKKQIGILCPRPPFKEVEVTRKSRRKKGDFYLSPMQKLTQDLSIDPILALNQIKRLVGKLREEFNDTQIALMQKTLTQREISLVDSIKEKAESSNTELIMLGLIKNDKLQKLCLGFNYSLGSKVDPVWRHEEFLGTLPDLDYFVVPSTNSHFDNMAGIFSAEGVFTIDGGRLPVTTWEIAENSINRMNYRIFRRFLGSRVGEFDKLGTPPVIL